MKPHSFFLLLFLFSSVYAQNEKIDKCKFSCLYTHSVQTLDPENKPAADSLISVLQIGEKVYKYEDLSKYADSKGFLPDSMNLDVLFIRSDPKIDERFSIYQNYPTFQQITVHEYLHPSYYVYDENPNLKWVLMDDTLSIMGYVCYKATTNYAGRDWTAWYTKDIAVSSGPWKFYGLPGLILQVEDTKMIHQFKAFSIFNTKDQAITYDTSARDEKMNRNKFIKQRNKLKCNAKWVKNPCYYDLGPKTYSKLTAESLKKTGAAPFWNVNGVKYNARIQEDGNVYFYYNHYQPLELE